MVPTLEAMKGGGGSIRVGTTGTIASLMNREMDSIKHGPQASIPSRSKHTTVSVSVPCGAIPRKTQSRRTLPDEASSSNNNGDHRLPVNSPKTRSNLRKNGHRVPMLSESDPTESNSSREKPGKKGSYLVEIVDLKCGNPDKVWSTPFTTRLKKLSFSKLSETVA